MYHLAWIPSLAAVLTGFFYIDFLKRTKTMTAEDIAEATMEEESEDNFEAIG